MIKEDSMKRRLFAARRQDARGLFVCIAALAAMAFLPSGAQASSYNVTVCDDSPGGTQNNSWVPYSNTPEIVTGQNCPASHVQTSFNTGMFVRNHAAPTWITARLVSGWQLQAPAGNTLGGITASYLTGRANGTDMYTGLYGDGGMVAGCPQGSTVCADVGTNKWFSLGNSTSTRVEVACGYWGGCYNNNTNLAYFLLYGATVTVNDNTAPSVTPWNELWHADYWQHGERGFAITAEDPADGIQETELRVDGKPYLSKQHACDFTKMTPCGAQFADYWLFDTAQLDDGPHSVDAIAYDAARLPTVIHGAIKVDNHAPSEPTGLNLDGGEDWRSSNDFAVSWAQPSESDASPVAAAHYSLCRANDAEDCPVSDQRVAGNGIASLEHISVPNADDYLLRVWLEDAAGNVDGSHLSDPVHLRFDPTVPGMAAPVRRNGWINAQEARAMPQRVSLDARAAVGPSGIKGYNVTSDGSMPGTTINAFGQDATLTINNLPEGRNIIKARAISGAGVAATDSDIGTIEVDVDKTAPDSSLAGAPDPSQWQRSPVAVTVTGTDQPNLSGMQGAAPGDDIKDGAYLEYRLDGSTANDVRGNVGASVNSETVSLTIPTDGQHTLTYQAIDFAGNESAEKAVQFKIDQTAPNVAAFEAQDPSHPTTLSVAVADRTSGVASGVIEIRQQGTSGWTDLATRLEGDHVVANVDDSTLTPGAYEFQAKVRDNAGNETVTNHRRDGSAEVLVAPFRFDTRMAVGIVKPAAKKTKPKKVSATCRRSKKCMAKVRKRRAAAKKKAKALKPLTGTVSNMTVAYGKSALVKGTLVSNDGTPIAQQPIDVYQQLDSTGQRFGRIGTLRTNGSGQFDYHAPKGASRTLRFQFDGTETLHPASAQVKLLVTATSTLKASKHNLLNGQSARFSGRIGRPVVGGLKLVDLQAFYRNKWRTFATPRTTAKGDWKYTYRFEATSGVVNYRFRVRVRREASYPYQLGYSKVVNVTVRGR